MNKILSIFILVFPIICFSHAELPPEINIPHGIEIVSNKADGKPPELKTVIQTENLRLKAQGKTPHSEYISYLLNLERNEHDNLINSIYIKNPIDTHLKKNIEDIKLNFVFNPINRVDQHNIIGFSVAGTWENGWTGVVEYFNDKELGVCAYSLDHIIHVKMNKSSTTLEVNNKPTFKRSEGNNKYGYYNNINWYTELPDKDVIEQNLGCANMKNNPKSVEKLIAMSCEIDSSSISIN